MISKTITHRILPVCILILAMANIAGCKKLEMESGWTETSIQVDGDFADWSELPVLFFEDQNASVGICNDNEYLYLHFRTFDQMTASMVRMTGMTVYFDPEAKKNEDIYLKYNDGPEPGARPGGNRPGKNIDPSLVCYIKDVIVGKQIPLDGTEGPSAGYKNVEGFYSYEIAIPLKESGVMDYGLGIQPGQEISIGLKYGGQPERPDGGRRGGGGMGERGRGGKGGGGRGGGGQKPEMPEEQEVWIKVTLAESQSDDKALISGDE